MNQILLNGGYVVNSLSLWMLKEFDTPIEELSQSCHMIQGFNQGGQRVVGSIRLECLIEEMAWSVFLHVIDYTTSYNMLLGRSWLHDNGVVPLMLNQSMLQICK